MRYIIFTGVVFLFFASCKNKKEISQGTAKNVVPVQKLNGEEKDEIELSEQQIQLGNIQTDTIRNGTFADHLVLAATLNFDQSKSTSVSSRVMGRIEKLYFKDLGDYVQKGTPLFELYSEELNNTKQEYLLLLDKKKTFENQTTIDYDQLLQAAKNKLMLWGMTGDQIAELTRLGKTSPTTIFYSNASGYITALEKQEGDYVMEGGTIVKLADLSGLWVEAQVYTSQLAGLDRHSIATVKIPDFDNREIKGKLAFVNPEVNPGTRINLIRIAIPNPGNLLKPGMPAYILLKSPQRKTLTLPIDAVIRDGRGSTIWVVAANRTFKSVMVETGLESGDRIEIISGLNAGDVVVTSGAYLLNSEYIFKKGANPMSGMKM